MNLTQIMALISQWSNDNGVAWNGTTVYGDSDSQPYHNPGIVDYLNGSLESGGVYVDNGDGNAPVMADYSPLVRFLLNHGVIPLGVNGSILGNLTLATQVKGMNPQQVLQYVTNAAGNIYIDSATGQAFWSNITGAPIPLATNVNYGYAVPSVTFTIPPNNSSFLKTLYTVVSGYFLDTGGAGLLTFAPFIAAGVSSAVQAISPTIAPVVEGTAVLNPAVINTAVEDSFIPTVTAGEGAATTINAITDVTSVTPLVDAASTSVVAPTTAVVTSNEPIYLDYIGDMAGNGFANVPVLTDTQLANLGITAEQAAQIYGYGTAVTNFGLSDVSKLNLDKLLNSAASKIAAVGASAALAALTAASKATGIVPSGYVRNPVTGLLQPVAGASSIFGTGSNMPLILGIGLFAILAMKGK